MMESEISREIHLFEDELQGPTPRSVPPFLKEGSFSRRRSLALGLFLLTGTALVFLSLVPWVRQLGLYIIPLGYIRWGGLACILLSGAAFSLRGILPGPFEYVIRGLPVSVRVLNVTKSPTAMVNGEPAFYSFQVEGETIHPETGEQYQTEISSEEFSATWKDHYSTRLKVGDLVTGVYLPSRFEKTLKLYGFLGLSEQASLIQKTPLLRKKECWRIGWVGACCLGLLGSLLWSLYALERFQPLDFRYQQAAFPCIAGGLLVAFLFVWATWREYKRRMSEMRERNAKAAAEGGALEVGSEGMWGRVGFYGWGMKGVLFLGATLLGATVTLGLCFSVNALLDSSEPTYLSTEVTGRLIERHGFLARFYHIEYLVPGTHETETFSTSPQVLSDFRADRCLLHVYEGRLGWPWVKYITPLERTKSIGI